MCAGLIGLWLVIDPRTADLAAAVYRSQLFARDGLTLWDNAWFGGHHLLGYSLISPALGSLFGPRATAALAVLCSAVTFAVLAQRHAERHARSAALWFAVAAVGDLFIGRLAFALGVTCALVAFAAWSYERPWLSYVMSAITAAASPVAGLFLALVAVGAIPSLGRRQGLMMAASALGMAGAMAVVFPEGGRQPYDLAAALAALTVCVARDALRRCALRLRTPDRRALCRGHRARLSAAHPDGQQHRPPGGAVRGAGAAVAPPAPTAPDCWP